MLKEGIYEKVIDIKLAKKLVEESANYHIEEENIDEAESSKILASYISKAVEKGLNNIGENGKDREDKINKKIKLTNKVISLLTKETNDEEFEDLTVEEQAKQLLAILKKENKILTRNKKFKVSRPETSLAMSSLFTGSDKEPSLDTEFKKEIKSSDEINMLVSFIKYSGLIRILPELKEFTKESGRKLRVITTSYMGATDIKAIAELEKLPNTEVKISYDTKRTRLHAKAYLFKRNSGYTTAYVGSSNLSNAAISTGLEWNVKVTDQDLPTTIDKIDATFESYWNTDEFEKYTSSDYNRLKDALKAEKHQGESGKYDFNFDIRPYSYQKGILDKLNAERNIHGRHKNLIVAATGTGKTVISAFDYKQFCKGSNRPKLLFVAHREEILRQSLNTFRGILRDANFGELLVGNYSPSSLDYLFTSIQSFNSRKLYENTSADFYDYIVVDEAHHIAAESYQKLLSYYKPKNLIGLTATPERMDGENILGYFDGKIAGEIRLPEAIERKLLCPFQYFGVTDTVDLKDLKWSKGGYDVNELTRVYALETCIAEKRASFIVDSINRYVADLDEVKGIGFCVSKEHAKFMKEFFNKFGISSEVLTSNSDKGLRRSVKQKLINGEIKFIFVVDLYNEGVDIPELNTCLFLRPTQSLTIFLQQLGRGLRLSAGKDCLTVLDFVGQANEHYNFENKFRALLNNSKSNLKKEIEKGFVSVPKGCFIQLEKKAKEYVLENISKSIDNKAEIIRRIKEFENETSHKYNLKNFFNNYDVNPRNFYKKGLLARLEVVARVRNDFYEELEEDFRKAFMKISSNNSRRWFGFLKRILPRIENVDFNNLSPIEYRMLQMFRFTVWPKANGNATVEEIKEELIKVKNNTTCFTELLELLDYLYEKIDFIDKEVELGFACPLDLHCTYTRDQILVAMDFMKPSTVREGVKYLKEKKVDLFFITLNKSEKNYSPTTMYNDYSINENLFHWNSQNATSPESNTGKRYINHKRMGQKILLFVREEKNESGIAASYTFLGKANYVSHKGSKPMGIIWRLEEPIPANFLKETNKLVLS